MPLILFSGYGLGMAEKKAPNPQDVRIGQNLARFRGAMSQAELAKKMRDMNKGHKWSQTTVWTVEKGERPLKLAEADTLAEILGINLDALLEDAVQQTRYELRRINLEVKENLVRVAGSFIGSLMSHNAARDVYEVLRNSGELTSTEVEEFEKELAEQEKYLKIFAEGLTFENMDNLLEQEA